VLHLADLVAFVGGAVLDDAQRIDPQVLESEVVGYDDGVL
jgi:hypothetical protein